MDVRAEIERRLRDEVGGVDKDAPESVALVYPSPYAVAMSSLGYQTIYRTLNRAEGMAAHRAFLPDDVEAWRRSRSPLLTYERMRPVSNYPVIAFSLAYEAEIERVLDKLADHLEENLDLEALLKISGR